MKLRDSCPGIVNGGCIFHKALGILDPSNCQQRFHEIRQDLPSYERLTRWNCFDRCRQNLRSLCIPALAKRDQSKSNRSSPLAENRRFLVRAPRFAELAARAVYEAEHPKRIAQLGSLRSAKLDDSCMSLRKRVLFTAGDCENDGTHCPEQRVVPDDSLFGAKRNRCIGPCERTLIFLREDQNSYALRIYAGEPFKWKTPFTQQRQGEIETRYSRGYISTQNPELAEADQCRNFLSGLRILRRQR